MNAVVPAKVGRTVCNGGVDHKSESHLHAVQYILFTWLRQLKRAEPTGGFPENLTGLQEVTRITA
jgi:hypothetical protein